MKIEIGNLLYHSVHGMCRVKEILSESSGKSYSLVPQSTNRSSYRYVVPFTSLEESGFHKPISSDGASEILDYFRTGKKAANLKPVDEKDQNSTWALAEAVMCCARDESLLKDQRKRSALNRGAFGLVREFAFAFKISAENAVNLIHKSLRGTAGSKMNPAILNALEKGLDDNLSS